MRTFLRLTTALLMSALGLRGASAQSTNSGSDGTAPAVRLRVVASGGVLYIHQPAFAFTRGTTNPRTITEQETDGGAVMFGGGLEALAERWWGGIGLHVALPLFDQSTSIITSVHGGPTLPRLLGGRVRLGLGPVLVRATRRERGLLGGLCLTDCTPVQYPPPLMTAGIGVVVITEWKPWTGVGIGLEGQAAAGAQRFATGRLRISLGS